MMITGVLERENLEVQRRAYGPLLKKAFPVPTRLDTNSKDRTGWAMFYLQARDMIGTEVYKNFKSLVATPPSDNESQERSIYAPLQVSGAGKTKLCITLGMELGAVLIRLNK